MARRKATQADIDSFGAVSSGKGTRRSASQEDLASFSQPSTSSAEAESSTLGEKAAAFTSGAARGASFGFSDEIGGAILAGKDVMTGGKNFMDAFAERSQQVREVQEGIEAEAPIAAGLGNVGGAIGTSVFAPGSALLRGGGVIKGLTGGAASGALFGIGEADLAENGFTEEAAQQIFTTSALGGAFGGTAGLVGKGLRALTREKESIEGVMTEVLGKTPTKYFKETVQELGETQSVVENAFKRVSKLKEFAGTLDNQDAVRAISPGQRVSVAASALDTRGHKIGAAIDKANVGGRTFNLKKVISKELGDSNLSEELVSDMEEMLSLPEMTANGKKAIKLIQKAINDDPKLDLRGLQKFKKSLDKVDNRKGNSTDEVRKFLNSARGSVRKLIEDVGEAELGDNRIAKLNKEFSDLKIVEELFEDGFTTHKGALGKAVQSDKGHFRNITEQGVLGLTSLAIKLGSITVDKALQGTGRVADDVARLGLGGYVAEKLAPETRTQVMQKIFPSMDESGRITDPVEIMMHNQMIEMDRSSTANEKAVLIHSANTNGSVAFQAVPDEYYAKALQQLDDEL